MLKDFFSSEAFFKYFFSKLLTQPWIRIQIKPWSWIRIQIQCIWIHNTATNYILSYIPVHRAIIQLLIINGPKNLPKRLGTYCAPAACLCSSVLQWRPLKNRKVKAVLRISSLEFSEFRIRIQAKVPDPYPDPTYIY